MLRAGALAVVREQESLNRINVFPVRDADTGANLAATLKAAAARLGSASPDGVGAAARVAADGALDGARGNSGAIFAQFLHGLAGGMERRSQVDGPQFADAARLGTESAYTALQDPREGTILSVLKAWSHELGRRSGEEDFTEMMHGGLVAAREALANTPHQLEVLARSHVVDAGGQGFVYFLEGIIESLRGRDTAWVPIEAPPHGLPPFALEHDEIDERFRYCTEALLTPREVPLSRDAVMAAVLGLGESLVVAGGERRLRVHIHTNEPQKFLATVAALGAIEHSKIDDMVLQQLAGRESTIALVTDSTTDLPEDTAFRLGVVAVPLTLTLGDESYLDGVDITLDGFIHRVTSGTGVPRSSQPAEADFVQTYRRLLEYREGIVSVHIAAAMSGTVQSAQAAAREVDPARIRVIDSCAVSVGAGLLLEAAGEAIAAGAGLDEVVAAAERAKREIRLFGTVASLDFAVRGGRVSPSMARTLKRLHLAPIIVFDETGKAGKGGAALGFDRALDAIIKRAVRFAAGAPARAMVVHSGDQAGADFVAARLAERLGGEVPVVRAGAVLTTHVGVGSVSVAVRRLPA
ncbi:MAG: DegV family EDD domain-containing protein [Actinobacteria bacterium]|nr:DegV family EDD domain-containing protein [Actinomycetota bacterium]